MNEEIKNIIDELEEKVKYHNNLGLMYEGQNDKLSEQTHFTAAFCFDLALVIVRKHTNKEGMLKLVK
jgi:hypothetical protein